MRKIIKLLSIFLCTVFVISFFILSNANLSNKIFGISFHIVVTNSMSGEIERGDVIIVYKTDIANVSVGQNILFFNNDTDEFVVHKVISKNNNIVQTAGIYPNLNIDDKCVTHTNFVGVATRNEVLTILYKIFTNFLFWLIFLFVALLCMVRKYKYH